MERLPADPVGRALAQMLARDRYERWVQGEVQTLLQQGFTTIGNAVESSKLRLGEKKRQALLLKQISGQLAQSYGKADSFVTGQMKEYAAVEAKATRQQMQMLVAKSKRAEVTLQNLTKAETRAIAEFPIAGLGIGDWFEKQATDMNSATRSTLQLGLLNGETPTQLRNRIVGEDITPEGATTVVKRSKNASTALVRTATTTVQTQASYETLKGIDERLVGAYRYVAVRDARTTPICRALDNRVFRFDDPKAKRPPQHVNCRSTIVGVVDYAFLGLPEPNTIKDGYTMGSYADWLKTIPASEQDDILGKYGGSLFRDGRANLADLVRDDGQRMTIKQLSDVYGERPAPIKVAPPAPEPKRLSAKEMAMQRLSSLDPLTEEAREFMEEIEVDAGTLARQRMAPFKGDPFGKHFELALEEANDERAWKAYNGLLNSPKAALPQQQVKLADLYRSQATVDEDTLRKYIENPFASTVDGNGLASDLPHIVKYRDKEWILDGHHRLTAQKLLGQDSAPVRYTDLDAVVKAEIAKEKALAEAAETTRKASGGFHRYARTTDLEQHPMWTHDVLEQGDVDDVETMLKREKTFSAGDPILSKMMHDQGFADLPEAVDVAEFETRLSRGEFSMQAFRGVGPINRYEIDYTGKKGGSELYHRDAVKAAQDFISGEKPFVGYGMYGNGHYTAATLTDVRAAKAAFAEASAYAGERPDGAIIRMGIRKDARIVRFDDLERQQEQARSLVSTERSREYNPVYKQQQQAFKAGDVKRAELLDEQLNSITQKFDNRMAIVNDPGRFATARGYDIIDTHNDYGLQVGQKYLVILNRTAVVVVKEPLRAGTYPFGR